MKEFDDSEEQKVQEPQFDSDSNNSANRRKVLNNSS